MTAKRQYDQGCGMAHALELIGERWAILIVRELLVGPRRFTDLRTGLPGISPNVLTHRLDELERSSIVVRTRLPPPASVWAYELTEWGKELGPVLLSLGAWALKSPTFPTEAPIGVSSFILSLEALFDPPSASGLEATIELHVNDQSFNAQIQDGRIRIGAGSATAPDVVVTGDPNILVAIIHRGANLPRAVRDGEVQLIGDRKKFRSFIDAFRPPRQAPSTYLGPAASRS